MADFGQFFNPGSAASVVPDTNQLRSQWDMYLNDPKTQAALLSFGAQAVQPMQFGQSGFGHLMSSIGQGGESVRKTEELDRKQQDAESKTDLRESQAIAAEARAGAAGARAGSESTRLELGRLREEGLRERSMLSRRVQAYKLYGDEVKRINAANAAGALTRGFVPARVPSPSDWFNSNRPLMEGIGITPEMLLNEPAPGGAGGDPTMSPPAPGASPAPSPQQAYPQPTSAAISALRSNPARRAEFDAKYGPNSSAQYLTGAR